MLFIISVIPFFTIQTSNDPFIGWNANLINQIIKNKPETVSSVTSEDFYDRDQFKDWKKNTIFTNQDSPFHIRKITELLKLLLQDYRIKHDSIITKKNQSGYPLSCIIQAKKYSKEKEYISVGDVHTDIATVWNIVSQYIDDNLCFKNENLNKHIIFLGDYVDRGPTSLPTILLLLVLQHKNSNNITLIRGNHETYSISNDYGLKDEIKKLYKKDNENNYVDVFNLLNNCFRYLSVALFLYDIETKKSVLYSHGLFDNDYDPTALLQQLQSDDIASDLYEQSMKGPNDSLFLWGDFYPTPSETPYSFMFSGRSRGISVSNVLSTTIKNYSERHNITHIFCAHQHVNDYTELTPTFCANCFHAYFNFSNVSLIRQGLCCGAGNAQPDIQFPGFIFTSTAHYSKDGIKIVVQPNYNTTTEYSRKIFSVTYGNNLIQHFQEVDFAINEKKIAFFAYLNEGYKRKNKNDSSIFKANRDEIDSYILDYATVSNSYIAFEYTNDGYQIMYYPDDPINQQFTEQNNNNSNG